MAASESSLISLLKREGEKSGPMAESHGRTVEIKTTINDTCFHVQKAEHEIYNMSYDTTLTVSGHVNCLLKLILRCHIPDRVAKVICWGKGYVSLQISTEHLHR
jgi:hypothetical protein